MRNWIPFIAISGIVAGVVVEVYLLAGLARFPAPKNDQVS